MQMSEQIIQVIDELCKKFGVAIDWTSKNVAPYIEKVCKKFISYEIYTSVFWICFISILCAVCWIVTSYFIKRAREVEWDDDYAISFITGIAVFVSMAISLTAIIVIGTQVYDIIEAKVFPEKFIFDYITTNFKKG